jgi:hypothetical protein
MTTPLKPCPLCGLPPHRFPVSGWTMRPGQDEVIACQKGCKPNWNSVLVHIRSCDIRGGGWPDLADAWNTVEVYEDERGLRRVRFQVYTPTMWQIVQAHENHSGPFCEWSPMISELRLSYRRPTAGPF